MTTVRKDAAAHRPQRRLQQLAPGQMAVGHDRSAGSLCNRVSSTECTPCVMRCRPTYPSPSLLRFCTCFCFAGSLTTGTSAVTRVSVYFAWGYGLRGPVPSLCHYFARVPGSRVSPLAALSAPPTVVVGRGKIQCATEATFLSRKNSIQNEGKHKLTSERTTTTKQTNIPLPWP